MPAAATGICNPSLLHPHLTFGFCRAAVPIADSKGHSINSRLAGLERDVRGVKRELLGTGDMPCVGVAVPCVAEELHLATEPTQRVAHHKSIRTKKGGINTPKATLPINIYTIIC